MNATEASSTLIEMISASWMSQVVCVAAELQIADLLAGGSKSAEDLARDTQCRPEPLRRLMRALASLGVCAEGGDGSFALTETGALLRTDATPSLRAWAIWWGRYRWPMWGELHERIRTGPRERQLTGGRDGDDQAAATVFNLAMVGLTRLAAAQVLRVYDFAAVGRLVDVGGGHGELLAVLLAAQPRLQGTLFDLPSAIAGAGAHLASAGVAERCELIAGSFFESVPGGGDVYLLKSILHSWSDERSRVILDNCRTAMPTGARLLLVERVMPERMSGVADERSVARSDLHMLVGSGGRERTQTDFRTLLAASRFEATRFIPAGPDFWVIEAVADPRALSGPSG